MLQNDVIKCCKMMSPHSNEPATWRNCVSRRHFFNNIQGLVGPFTLERIIGRRMLNHANVLQ